MPTARTVAQSREFFIRNWRQKPVTTQEESLEVHCPYQGVPHLRTNDSEMALMDWLRHELERLCPQGFLEGGHIYRIEIVDTGHRTKKVEVPWVLLKPHEYGPNPTGKPA